MIIWLASYPRSGNSFFRALLKHVYGLSTTDVHPSNVYPSSVTHERLAINRAIGHVERDVAIPRMAEADRRYIVKTHDMPKEDYAGIYLVRDGRDALVSHAHYILEFDRGLSDEPSELYLETLRMLIETDTSFGGWGSNVLAWTSRATRTVVVKFEALIRTPLECLRQAMAGVGYRPPEISRAGVPTFDELHTAAPRFFRKGRVGAWRDEMPEDLHRLFWQRYGEGMHRMGYA